jgi:hypothetical protein
MSQQVREQEMLIQAQFGEHKLVVLQRLNDFEKKLVCDLQPVPQPPIKEVPSGPPKAEMSVEELDNLKNSIQKVQEQVGLKVDVETLENLSRHLASRKEITRHIADKIEGVDKRIDDLKHDVKEVKLSNAIAKVGSRASLEATKSQSINRSSNGGLMAKTEGGKNGGDFDVLFHRIMHTVDERLYVLSADVSTLRIQQSNAINEARVRRGVWLWKSAALKYGSGVVWSVESYNSDSDNLRWEPDACVIRVEEAGLYALQFGFFTRLKPSIQVVVNGESVMSAIHSPTYTVHHGSGFVVGGGARGGVKREGSATGLSLHDFLCLPSKSTVCLHWHGRIEPGVEGFMELRRVI